MQKFMRDNEEFLLKVLKEQGKTNLGDFFLNYLREKDSQAHKDKMRGAMLPPSMLNDSKPAEPMQAPMSPGSIQPIAPLMFNQQQVPASQQSIPELLSNLQ